MPVGKCGDGACCYCPRAHERFRPNPFSSDFISLHIRARLDQATPPTKCDPSHHRDCRYAAGIKRWGEPDPRPEARGFSPRDATVEPSTNATNSTNADATDADAVLPPAAANATNTANAAGQIQQMQQMHHLRSSQCPLKEHGYSRFLPRVPHPQVRLHHLSALQ